MPIDTDQLAEARGLLDRLEEALYALQLPESVDGPAGTLGDVLEHHLQAVADTLALFVAGAGNPPPKVYVMARTANGAASVANVHVGRTARPLEHHVQHSADGFSWGYAGSGPAELARCILWDHLGAEPHPACYQAFKRQFVAAADREGFTVDEPQIADWLAGWKANVDGGTADERGTRRPRFATIAEYSAWLTAQADENFG